MVRIIHGANGLSQRFFFDAWMDTWPGDCEEVVDAFLDEVLEDNTLFTAFDDEVLGFAFWMPVRYGLNMSEIIYYLQAESFASAGKEGSQQLLRDLARDAQKSFGGELIEEYYAACPPPKLDVKRVSDAYLSLNYVFPQYRNQGIGRALLDARMSHLAQTGFQSLYSHCSNNVSVNLLVSRGFQKILLSGPRYSDGKSSTLMYKKIND